MIPLGDAARSDACPFPALLAMRFSPLLHCYEARSGPSLVPRGNKERALVRISQRRPRSSPLEIAAVLAKSGCFVTMLNSLLGNDFWFRAVRNAFQVDFSPERITGATCRKVLTVAQCQSWKLVTSGGKADRRSDITSKGLPSLNGCILVYLGKTATMLSSPATGSTPDQVGLDTL